MANKQLSEIQLKFIDVLFGSAKGSLQEAAAQTGIANYASLMTMEAIDEIKRRADNEMVLNVPKAVNILSNIMNKPESVPFMQHQLKCAESVLDRGGISKQERQQSAGTQLGLVFLPAKNLLPPPPTEELEGEVLGISSSETA